MPVDDFAFASEGLPINIDVLDNDQYASGSYVCDYDLGGSIGGKVKMECDSSFTYTPPDDFCGKVDTFTYTICNQHCQPSTATVTIESNCDISCPVAMNDAATTSPGTAVTINVLSNDININDATICNVESPTANGGTAVISDNKIIYTPKAGFCGPRRHSLTRSVKPAATIRCLPR